MWFESCLEMRSVDAAVGGVGVWGFFKQIIVGFGNRENFEISQFFKHNTVAITRGFWNMRGYEPR